MNRKRLILLVSMLVCSIAVSAQPYERMVRNSLWSASDNVTGIRQDTVSASYAELYAGYEGGEFRDTWQASEGWNAGARTASVRHMERISYAGSFSFKQTEGYDMCGSMFIRPGSYPVDILEFTPGRKTLQTYQFDGGFSFDLDSKWRIGAMMDFESANIAKRKDLRHSNSLLDMTVAPGFMYHDGDFAVGASAVFGKVSERVEAEQVGTSESSYYAFLDKGTMRGVYSVWNGSGLHLEESGVNGFPVNELSYGASAQVQYRDFFADFKYMQTSGKVGEKEYIWFRYPGNEMVLNMRYRIVGRYDGDHYFRLSAGRKKLVMHETVLEKVSENGIVTVLNHGQNRILSRQTWSLSPQYEFVHHVMEVQAGAELNVKQEISSQIYPFVFGQTFTQASAYVGMVFHLGRFDWGAKGTYGRGWFSEDVKVMEQDTGIQTSPYRPVDWYDRHVEYLTATRFRSQLMARYNFERGIYLGLDMSSVKGRLHPILKPGGSVPVEAVEKYRLEATLKVGMNF